VCDSEVLLRLVPIFAAYRTLYVLAIVVTTALVVCNTLKSRCLDSLLAGDELLDVLLWEAWLLGKMTM
jgi:hypothetical protein